MSRALDDLTEIGGFRQRVFVLLARLTERGYPVQIIDTLRTPAEHAVNLRNGTSRAKVSKHLSGEDGYSRAIDLCPYEVYTTAPGGDKLLWMEGKSRAEILATPAWRAIGEEARELGLRWGGDWTDPFDPGHVELV